MKNAQRFKHTNVPRQSGEIGRFKVVQGPDYGAVYVLTGKIASIGRGEDCDLVISDLKTSRLHAELVSSASGVLIRDKASSNGILHNGKTVREANLKLGDTVSLGETTLEFVTSDAATMMLVAPPRSADQIKAEQKMMNERKEKIQAMGLLGSSGSSDSPGLFKNKAVLYGVLAVGGLFLLLGPDDTPKPPKEQKQSTDSARDLASFLPNAEVSRATETIFKDGMREYYVGNYNRARTQFETVLQISPGHELATLYLENCDKAVKEEVKIHLEYGKKSFQAGKLRDARAHFERVMRLLYRDQSNPAYIEAKDQFEKVTKTISGGAKS
jgi:pSer/pThr/pTyr-binding forkhead associated (FHA) protein